MTTDANVGPFLDVMLPSAPIAGIESRIAVIRSRLEPGGTASHPLVRANTPLTPPAPVDFEPFGQVYQDALEAVRAQPPAESTLDQATWQDGDRAFVQSASGLSSATSALFTSAFTSPFSTSAAGAHGGGCTHCAALSTVGPMGPTVDPSATPTGTSVGKIGGYGRLGPPAELVGYGNGKIPADALDTIGQGGHRLYAPAAASWRNLVDAAAADGIEMSITDSYRSYDQQVDLVRRKGLYSQGGLGATPGTSNHGWGLAVDADVTSPAALDWMRSNAWRFGFVEAVPREPWHWEFRPHQA